MIGTLPRFLVRGASTRQSVSFSASSKEMVRRIDRSFEGVVVPYDNAVRSRWHKQKNSARLWSAFIFVSVRWNVFDRPGGWLNFIIHQGCIRLLRSTTLRLNRAFYFVCCGTSAIFREGVPLDLVGVAYPARFGS